MIQPAVSRHRQKSLSNVSGSTAEIHRYIGTEAGLHAPTYELKNENAIKKAAVYAALQRSLKSSYKAKLFRIRPLYKGFLLVPIAYAQSKAVMRKPA